MIIGFIAGMQPEDSNRFRAVLIGFIGYEMGRLVGRLDVQVDRIRRFGNLKYRPSKENPTRIVASYPTPV